MTPRLIVLLSHSERRALLMAIKPECRLADPVTHDVYIDGVSDIAFRALPLDELQRRHDARQPLWIAP